MQCLHYIYNPSLRSPNPIRELHIIRNSCAKHYQSYMIRQHYNRLFPYHSSLSIIDVMNLIENDPFYISYHLSPSVKIIPKNFSSHDDATSLGVHAHISRYYAY